MSATAETVKSQAPMNLKILLESQTLQRAPFPVPVGWYFIDYSDNLKAGEMRLINLFDQEWVLFRTESGQKVGVTDPYCPHLGAHIGHHGKVHGDCVQCPYHGWTYGTDAVSTSTADNPNALATRPDWVHTVESPNSFRGKYRGAEADRYAVDAVAQIEGLIADGRAPAGFIAESVYGNAGGMALPDGYLEQVYAAVRAGGGLAIADEVQVGYGRLGKAFWGSQFQGVIPDIIGVAKATGNGHPVGAVITTHEIAQRFGERHSFFSSVGGTPVSCEIGIAVLDALRDERLQENAVEVGARLRAGLEELARRHPIIGAVHGTGLYLGVDLVRDHSTREPATEEAYAICERLRELGVIDQPTGDHENVLKVKPPLCINAQDADEYVRRLDRVLSEGW